MDKINRPIYVNITAMTVFKIILIIILFYFLYVIRDIVMLLFVSLILSSALDPWVDWMQNKKIPRSLGIIIIYLVLILGLGFIIYLLIPPIVEQIKELGNNFPLYYEKILSGISFLKDYSAEYGLADNIKNSLTGIDSNIQNVAGSLFTTVSGIFGSIFSFFLVLVITFYVVAEENSLKKIIWSVAPEQHQVYVMRLVNRMQRKIGLWLRGQLILSAIIFALTYIGLTILKVKYALVLALLAGFTEFVPYLGPIIAAIPAIFLSFTIAPSLAGFVAILYYIIHLVENNIIVPKLMQKVVGLNPVVIIAVLLIGFQIAGIAGAILSIPVATAASVFIKDVFEQRDNKTTA